MTCPFFALAAERRERRVAAFVYRGAKAGARIDVTDQKQPDSEANDTRDKGDLHKRLDQLAQDLDDLEKEAIPPKVKPADVGGIIGD